MDKNIGRFIIFSVITNIYNKKTKGSTLLEFYTPTGKLKKLIYYHKNLNIVSMCAVSPVVHTSNISSCQKKNLFQFSCGCEKFH